MPSCSWMNLMKVGLRVLYLHFCLCSGFEAQDESRLVVYRRDPRKSSLVLFLSPGWRES